MGLLSEGSPLTWSETKNWSDHVRQHGIKQFINLYHRLKDRKNDCLKWGDEVEYMMVQFDHRNKKAYVKLRAVEILDKLQEKERKDPGHVKSLWRPEFGSYMIEGTPGKPYGGLLSHFNIVEANMRTRRAEVQAYLEKDEEILCLTNFPRLGCKNFTYPEHVTTPGEGYTRSLFFPDAGIFPGHPRFRTLVRNIRERRGRKVVMNVPIYRDKNTPNPFVEDFTLLGDDGEAAKASLPNYVYLDAMGFGMGCCCLQVTFQACSIDEARLLYDQLTPICPIMLALSAANPAARGFLVDTDCRWNVIAGSVDDRTEEEMGMKPLSTSKFRFKKSRYDTISCYISPGNEKYNDIEVVYDPSIYDTLKSAGIDDLLAQHIAHIFARDPISLFSEKIHQNDDEDSDHFENLQSTNWNSMRFKPPPPKTSIGWRVEFRPMELQMTEFENAAYTVFVVLLTRVVLSYKLNLLLPISKVDENMQTAHKRDALLTEKFWFRKDVFTPNSPISLDGVKSNESSEEFTQMTISEIINGNGLDFPGLIPMIKKFLSSIDVDVDTQCTIQQYLKLIQKRASGELMTNAHWMRHFITSHPDYKCDSVISELINYDLLMYISKIQQNIVSCPELLGNPISKSKARIPKAVKKYEEQDGESLSTYSLEME